MMNGKEKWMLACAVFLVLVMGSVFLRLGTAQILVKKLHIDNIWTEIVLWDNKELRNIKPKSDIPKDEIRVDWANEYPFPDYSETTTSDNSNNKSFPMRVTKKASSVENRIRAWTSTQLMGYIDLVNYANFYNKSIGWNIPMMGGYNSVVALDDGQLVDFKERKDMTPMIEAVAKLNDSCHKQGCQFFVAMAPGKISRKETELAGKLDFSNQNGDAFEEGLTSHGIACLDLRDTMEAEVSDTHELFYRTDHHWKASTGRWAAEIIAKYLNDRLGYKIDTSLMKSEQYREVFYPSWFLGSRGKKVTLSRTTPDDFALYYPKFVTSFHYEIPSMDKNTDGDFSVMYDMKKVEPLDYYGLNPYGAYNYGDRALIKIHNNMVEDGKKILILKNSYADSVIPFLSVGVETIHVLDLRHFTGSLQTYMKVYKPDTVILLFQLENLKDKIDFKTHKDFWDFR